VIHSDLNLLIAPTLKGHSAIGGVRGALPRTIDWGVQMGVLAFLIMVLLPLAMGRLVVAALAIQKNTREVADHFI
jgi:hypothetical protein